VTPNDELPVPRRDLERAIFYIERALKAADITHEGDTMRVPKGWLATLIRFKVLVGQDVPAESLKAAEQIWAEDAAYDAWKEQGA
jgi:hypothetical protein